LAPALAPATAPVAAAPAPAAPAHAAPTPAISARAAPSINDLPLFARMPDRPAILATIDELEALKKLLRARRK